MAFCKDCGTKLISRYLKNEGEIPYCETCGKFCFPQYNVAVSMVTVDEEKKKVLLIQQYGRPFWILVAGYVNRGESAETAVIREIREEVSLTVRQVTFNRSRFFEPSNTLMLNFTASVDSDEPVSITDEVDRWKWFSYEEARDAIKPDSLARQFYLGWLEDHENKKAGL
ncbi:MAG: NUDIX domain-containing protein [Clostridia bacterium]|nr:NUDIX domain-containing protein [Clostridia bacterium]